MQNIQGFTLQCEHQSKVHPNYTKFLSLLSNDYPYFSYIYRFNSRTQIRSKPKSFEIAHFSIKYYFNFQSTTTPKNHFCPTIPISPPCSVQHLTSLKSSLWINPTLVQQSYQNLQVMLHTFPTEHIGYEEVITKEKPKYYQVNSI